MANRLVIKGSVRAEVELTDAEGPSKQARATDIPDDLYGEGEVPAPTYAGVVDGEVTVTTGGTVIVTAGVATKLAWIRHTGKDSSGAATTAYVDLNIGTPKVARLYPGMSIPFSEFATVNASNTIQGVASAGTVNVRRVIVD